MVLRSHWAAGAESDTQYEKPAGILQQIGAVTGEE